MDAALMLLFFVIAGALVYLQHHLKQKRRNEMAAFARKFGLHFSAVDTFGLLGRNLALFQKGDGRGTENIMWGMWKDMGFVAGDYWYYDESHDADGGRNRTYHYFSVALIDIAAYMPPIQITRENILTRIADHLSLRDIEFESGEFNDRFQVKAGDRKFAYELVDAPMMHWLMTVAGPICFEIGGQSVLCYCKRLKPNQMLQVIGYLKEFRDHIPRLVRQKYGTEAFGLPVSAYSHVPPPVGMPPEATRASVAATAAPITAADAPPPPPPPPAAPSTP